MKNRYGVEVPDSILTRHQTRNESKEITYEGQPCRMVVNIRWDDECRNGHNSFSITGEIHEIGKRRRDSMITGGCIHEEIKKHFPEFAKFIKWHLCGSDAPMHYLENTMYLAGDKDCHGLRKGEFKQFKDRETGQLAWELIGFDKDGNEVETYKMEKHVDSDTKPDCPYRLEYRPWGRTGEGKEPELESARNSAIWPEATIEELTSREKLLERLPKLMEEFKNAMEELGFVY